MEISDLVRCTEAFDTPKGFAAANETRLAKIKRAATEMVALNSDLVVMVWIEDCNNEQGWRTIAADRLMNDDAPSGERRERNDVTCHLHARTF